MTDIEYLILALMWEAWLQAPPDRWRQADAAAGDALEIGHALAVHEGWGP